MQTQDELMVKLIIEKGTKHWSSIASELNTNRTGKQVGVPSITSRRIFFCMQAFLEFVFTNVMKLEI